MSDLRSRPARWLLWGLGLLPVVSIGACSAFVMTVPRLEEPFELFDGFDRLFSFVGLIVALLGSVMLATALGILALQDRRTRAWALVLLPANLALFLFLCCCYPWLVELGDHRNEWTNRHKDGLGKRADWKREDEGRR